MLLFSKEEITVKASNTANRLKQIMDERHLKQIDILNACVPFCKKYGIKMNKSDLSQYISGKAEPSQNKLFILGSALNVNETWLMGFDVSPKRNNCEDLNTPKFDSELNEAIKLIESQGFTISYSDGPYGDIISVKNGVNDIIFHNYDWELVNRYEAVYRKHHFINATLLLGLDDDPKSFSKLYSIPKPGSAHYAFSDIDNRLSDIVYSFQELNETGKDKAHSYVLDLYEQPKYRMATISSAPIAAHNDYETESGKLEKMRADISMPNKHD